MKVDIKAGMIQLHSLPFPGKISNGDPQYPEPIGLAFLLLLALFEKAKSKG